MKKILVTGNAGSGKTAFSSDLARALQIRLWRLDSIVWKPGWQETSIEERREKIQVLVDGDSWVIDGVSSQVFLAADTVFFLDIPLYRCVFNIVKRFFYNGFKTRESLPANCPEIFGVFKAIKIAFIYQKVTRPIILNVIAENRQKKIVWIRTYGELAKHQPVAL